MIRKKGTLTFFCLILVLSWAVSVNASSIGKIVLTPMAHPSLYGIEDLALPLETPDSRTVVIFEPYTWDLEAYDLGAKASAHGYSVQRYADGTSTITAFRNAINQPADVAQRRNGIIYVYTHGATDYISIEAFRIKNKYNLKSIEQAETACKNKFKHYTAAGYVGLREGIVPDGKDDDHDWRSWLHDVGMDREPGTNDPGEGDGKPTLGEPHVDEDPVGDLNNDGFPGVKDVDDDGDGLIDEDSNGRQPREPGYINDLKDDDDEDGETDEDPDVVAFDIGVSPQFIAKYAKNLPNSLVFISSCYSSLGNLAENFIAAGAHNYIGYPGPASTIYGIGPDYTFWNRMWWGDIIEGIPKLFNVEESVAAAGGSLTAHIANDKMVLYHKGKLIEVSRPPDNELYGYKEERRTLTFKVKINNTGRYADVYQINFEIFDKNDQSLGIWEGKTGVSVAAGSTSGELPLNWPLDSAHYVNGDGIYKVVLGLWNNNPDYPTPPGKKPQNEDGDEGEGEDRILHTLGKTAKGIFIWVYKITEVYPFVASHKHDLWLKPGETGSTEMRLKNIGTYFTISDITDKKAGPSWISLSPDPPTEMSTRSEWTGKITARHAPPKLRPYVAKFTFTGKLDPDGPTVTISVEAVIYVTVFVIPEFPIVGTLGTLVAAFVALLFRGKFSRVKLSRRKRKGTFLARART